MKEHFKPLISIVVPIYNIEDYLRRCISSIMGQTYTNLEIILVDDGSTDTSYAICDEFAEKDQRIRVLHKENGGLVSARKAGINVARGEYVLNIDGDDWVEEKWVEGLVNQIYKYPADMIYMSGYSKDIEGESRFINSVIKKKNYYGEEILEEVFPLLQNTNKCFEETIRGQLCMWGIKRKLLKEKQNLVDNRISNGEDQICIWFCLLAAESVSLINHYGYHYIQRSSSISYSVTDIKREGMKIWHCQLKEYLKKYNVSYEIMRIFTFLNTKVVLLTDYDMMLLKECDYLYPYTKVVKNSNIVIYGAGKLGCHMVQALDQNNDFHIVLWVDKNEKRPTVLDYKINPVEDIKRVKYDFIVIAVLIERMALEIKEELLAIGAKEEKIALMDFKAVSEEYLEQAFEKSFSEEELY